MNGTLVTYDNVSPEHIRAGDRVQDAMGRDYIADRDAEWNENSLSYDVRRRDDMRWVSYDFLEGVTLTYPESNEYNEY